MPTAISSIAHRLQASYPSAPFRRKAGNQTENCGSRSGPVQKCREVVLGNLEPLAYGYHRTLAGKQLFFFTCTTLRRLVVRRYSSREKRCLAGYNGQRWSSSSYNHARDAGTSMQQITLIAGALPLICCTGSSTSSSSGHKISRESILCP
jgi:hypothetical protein